MHEITHELLLLGGGFLLVSLLTIAVGTIFKSAVWILRNSKYDESYGAFLAVVFALLGGALIALGVAYHVAMVVVG